MNKILIVIIEIIFLVIINYSQTAGDEAFKKKNSFKQNNSSDSLQKNSNTIIKNTKFVEFKNVNSNVVNFTIEYGGKQKDTYTITKDSTIVLDNYNNILWLDVKINDFDELKYIPRNLVLDIDSVVNKNNEKIVQESVSKKDANERLANILTEANENISYYTNKLSGKSSNKIADILYDEGFGRRYETIGTDNYTIYGKMYTYENGDSYTIRVYTWYSYGYGEFYYDIRLSVNLKDYGEVIRENKDTPLMYNLKDNK